MLSKIGYVFSALIKSATTTKELEKLETMLKEMMLAVQVKKHEMRQRDFKRENGR